MQNPGLFLIPPVDEALFGSHSAISQADVAFRTSARTAGTAGFRTGRWLIEPTSGLSFLSWASLTTLPIFNPPPPTPPGRGGWS